MSESSSNITSCRNKVRNVDEAEKEASEVLHTLLSVERIERPDNLNNLQHQVVVLSNNGDEIQWHANGFQHNGQMYTIDTSGYSHDQDNTIVWDNSLSLDVETTEQTEDEWILPHSNTSYHYQTSKNKGTKVKSAKKTLQKVKKKTVKPSESVSAEGEEEVTETDGTEDVRERFRLGCECQDISCFRGLSVDNVYRHRLNIAELTKEEHDMYLMGVTMACMSDPDVTVKHRERRRLRAQYVYQGRRVCLSAFLYLENCTLYQLKRIRKHVMTHGVTPRVHGNHGKKPHNVFSLDTYRRATDFLRDYIKQHNALTGNNKNTVIFPPEISRKAMHNMYLEHMAKSAPPDEKTMGYSTFRHFMKEQFPHVRFCKVELGTQSCGATLNQAKPSPVPSAGNTSRATNTEEPQEVVVQAAPAAVQASQAVTTGMVLIQDQLKPCGELGQTAYLVPVGQLMPQYQTAHAITVAPFTNYAFAAL